MKSIDILCASPASTAICSNTNTDSRAILPQDLRRKDHKLINNPFMNNKPPKYEAPCSSRRLPLDPITPFYARKSTSSSSSSSSAKKTHKILRRKSSADASDLSSSSRCLLSTEKPFLDFIPESGRAMVSRQLRRDHDNLCNIKYKRLNSDSYSGFRSNFTRSSESPVFTPTSSNGAAAASSQKNLDLKLSSRLMNINVLESPSVPSNHQVVELMVSIHCKGCEGKLRKHITKMEGVTSFIIDLPTKKVTVIGDVTPLGVLTSISKVKNAQLWPSPSAHSPRVALTSSVFR
ncbi:uncharacterized protein [Henckelia pumila]|uniref:uncharacterized protein n=1 Tax=Henckelia pumila TaxID=405737 RepID=UPI003C6E9941